MEKKKYSSYAQIELDLAILKTERALNLQKIVLNVHKTKENLSLIGIVKGLIGNYKSIMSTYSGILINIAIPFIINGLLKRKRGN